MGVCVREREKERVKGFSAERFVVTHMRSLTTSRYIRGPVKIIKSYFYRIISLSRSLANASSNIKGNIYKIDEQKI